MGYLRYATTYKVKYDGGDFSKCEYEINSLLRELCPNMWDNNDIDTGYADELEIQRQDVEEAIKTLKKWHDDGEDKIFWMHDHGYTYLDIANFLEKALEHSDQENDYIRLAWF